MKLSELIKKLQKIKEDAEGDPYVFMELRVGEVPLGVHTINLIVNKMSRPMIEQEVHLRAL